MEKSKIQTPKMMGKDGKKNYNKFAKVLSAILLLLSIAISFLHVFFPPENYKIILLNSERAKIKTSWNKKELEHDNLFKNNLISKEEYFKIKEANEIKRKDDFSNINRQRKKLQNEFSFNGRESLHYWLWIFGITSLFFLVSCFLALKDTRLKKANLLKWYEPYASMSFIFISLFWLCHTVFQKDTDFKFTTYTTCLIISLIPISYFIYHFLRRALIIEEKLQDSIRILVSHVLENTKEDKEDEKWEVLDKISKNGK